MAIITTSTTTTGVNIALGAAEDLFVAKDVTRISSTASAVTGLFSNHRLDILGTLYGDENGILLGTAGGGDLTSNVMLGADAAVIGVFTGLRTIGSTLSIFNAGLISGINGINHDGVSFFSLVNHGRIVGTSTNGIEVDGAEGSIINHGTISGFVTGIVLENSAGPLATTRVENYGTIEGKTDAIRGSDGDPDVILNHGRIISNILLRGGDDVYDGHDGTVSGSIFAGNGADTLIGGAGREVMSGDAGNDSLEGGAGNDVLNGGADADTLDGGEGNDHLRPGAGADEIDGGAGVRDVLDYSFGIGPVTVNLATGDGDGGDATGDLITGIEDVIGTVGLDVLTGDGQANRLFGGGSSDLLVGGAGNDRLVGGSGVDTLNGGAGVDVLSGGENADVFRFITPAEIGTAAGARDRIIDFSKAEGDRIDLSFIDANGTLAGNQAFTFTTLAAFSAPGQVRAEVIGGNTFVFGNTDATPGTAEFTIALTGVIALAGTDFIL
jgi:Ca2+-binding RTX toxin-like protein